MQETAKADIEDYRFVPDSPSLLTVTLLSLYRFFVSILPIFVDQLRFWICLRYGYDGATSFLFFFFAYLFGLLDGCNSGPLRRFPVCWFRSLKTCVTPLGDYWRDDSLVITSCLIALAAVQEMLGPGLWKLTGTASRTMHSASSWLICSWQTEGFSAVLPNDFALMKFGFRAQRCPSHLSSTVPRWRCEQEHRAILRRASRTGRGFVRHVKQLRFSRLFGGATSV